MSGRGMGGRMRRAPNNTGLTRKSVARPPTKIAVARPCDTIVHTDHTDESPKGEGPFYEEEGYNKVCL